MTRMILERQFVLEIAHTSFKKRSMRKILSKRHILTVFSSHFNKALIIFWRIYYYFTKSKVENVFVIYFKTNIQNFFFFFVYFVCHMPQFKMLVYAFQSEIWIAQNFNITVFEDFCLSLSWKYRFSQNVNHAKLQSKTNKYCKFHVSLTRRRLSQS